MCLNMCNPDFVRTGQGNKSWEPNNRHLAIDHSPIWKIAFTIISVTRSALLKFETVNCERMLHSYVNLQVISKKLVS